MSLLTRCWCYLRIVFVASLIVLGTVAVPGIALANDGVTEPPVEISETTDPVPDPVDTPLPESPPEVPVTDLPANSVPAIPPSPIPAPAKPAIPAPANPAPVLPAPGRPAPVQPAPVSGTDQSDPHVPTEEALPLEAEGVEESIPASSASVSSSASPKPSGKPKSSAAPTGVPSATQSEEPETVVSSSSLPGGSTVAQWLMIGLLLALGVLYLRFMRRGVKHVTSPEGQPSSETGK